MMEAQEDDDEIFVYMGGDQEVPERVRRARIHISVKIITRRAFYHRRHLISVELHDGIEIIEEEAFDRCFLLSGSIKLLGVRIIKEGAFFFCSSLTDVEFGDKLETIGEDVFSCCHLLRNITMPHVRTIGVRALYCCEQLTDLELPERLETVGYNAFNLCQRLRRIALPLKSDMIGDNVFGECPQLKGVEVSTKLLPRCTWRAGEMK